MLSGKLPSYIPLEEDLQEAAPKEHQSMPPVLSSTQHPAQSGHDLPPPTNYGQQPPTSYKPVQDTRYNLEDPHRIPIDDPRYLPSVSSSIPQPTQAGYVQQPPVPNIQQKPNTGQQPAQTGHVLWDLPPPYPGYMSPTAYIQQPGAQQINTPGYQPTIEEILGDENGVGIDQPKPPSYLWASILTCFFCNWCFGAAALHYSWLSRCDADESKMARARRNGKTALQLSVASLIFGIVAYTIMVLRYTVDWQSLINSAN